MTSFVFKNNKKLKCGYTTGTCATAAAIAATKILLGGQKANLVKVKIPDGNLVELALVDIIENKDFVSCAVKKDAGDDPDVTNGLKIYAKVSKIASGLEIVGGQGIGLVKAKGLSCLPGEHAINPGPKEMIKNNLAALLANFDYLGGLKVEISIPGGEEVSKRTFNSRLGIVGGLSILGTTGIVEPMSEKAVLDTIKLFIDQKSLKDAENILLAPGNIGLDYIKKTYGIDIKDAVKISNFIGEALDYIVYKNFKTVLLVGHVGKLVKMAAGIMNTHSKYADGRLEIIAAHSALLGAKKSLIEDIFNSTTTKAVFDLLEKEDFYPELCHNLIEKIEYHLINRSYGRLKVGVVMFADGGKLIASSKHISEFIGYFKKSNIKDAS